MIVLYVYINDLNVRGVVAQLVGRRTYSVQPRSREFRPGRGCVTTLGKLFDRDVIPQPIFDILLLADFENWL